VYLAIEASEGQTILEFAARPHEVYIQGVIFMNAIRREEIMLFRQGDLFIESAETVPDGTTERASGVLLEGELTGHSHRIEDAKSALVHERLGQMFIEVIGDRAAVVHQEHATILLPRGVYRAWRQREYDPPRPTSFQVASERTMSAARFVRD
jgi:hypothetical protein